MVILSGAQQSRRIPRINQWVTLRDLIRSLPVRSASGHPVHVAASPAAPFSTPLGMTVKIFILNSESVPALRAGFQERLVRDRYGLRCIAIRRFARITGGAGRVNRY